MEVWTPGTAIVTIPAAIRSTASTRMADEDSEYATWLPVIGRSLARLAMSKAAESDRDKFRDVLTRVDFLESLGLPAEDSAEAAGSTLASVNELKRLRRNKGGKKAGKKSAKKARGSRR